LQGKAVMTFRKMAQQSAISVRKRFVVYKAKIVMGLSIDALRLEHQAFHGSGGNLPSAG
jgi:hypothetical protein